eukprot:TRINITY_DN13960_c0_g1_i1.p1 TRINITY_DN13960_c0_g1~~TRINITY_DN13960_c0_g1_i1.p1  ORF type:complete len:412 (+),score=80.13 TRINITY_DN13960_c0_g1_i1:68-1237(+)
MAGLVFKGIPLSFIVLLTYSDPFGPLGVQAVRRTSDEQSGADVEGVLAPSKQNETAPSNNQASKPSSWIAWATKFSSETEEMLEATATLVEEQFNKLHLVAFGVPHAVTDKTPPHSGSATSVAHEKQGEHADVLSRLEDAAVHGMSAQNGPIPGWLWRRALVIIVVIGLFMAAFTSVLLAGLIAVVQGRNTRQDLLSQLGQDANGLADCKAVVAARLEILCGLIDSVALYSQGYDEGEKADKALTSIFNGIMERILACKNDGLLKDEVENLLDVALEGNSRVETKDKVQAASTRRRLTTDLLGAATGHAMEPLVQAKLHSVLLGTFKDRIKDLIADGTVSEEVQNDLDAAAESDSLLRLRLENLVEAQQATESCLAVEGCISALVASKK